MEDGLRGGLFLVNATEGEDKRSEGPRDGTVGRVKGRARCVVCCYTVIPVNSIPQPPWLICRLLLAIHDGTSAEPEASACR